MVAPRTGEGGELAVVASKASKKHHNDPTERVALNGGWFQ
jgi:hypothetical protein